MARKYSAIALAALGVFGIAGPASAGARDPNNVLSTDAEVCFRGLVRQADSTAAGMALESVSGATRCSIDLSEGQARFTTVGTGGENLVLVLTSAGMSNFSITRGEIGTIAVQALDRNFKPTGPWRITLSEGQAVRGEGSFPSRNYVSASPLEHESHTVQATRDGMLEAVKRSGGLRFVPRGR